MSHYGIAVVRRGREREAVTVREGIAGVVRMDKDSRVGERGMMVVQVMSIESGSCKMMLKSLCVVHLPLADLV